MMGMRNMFKFRKQDGGAEGGSQEGGANGEKGRKDSRASEVGHFRPGENRKDGSLKGSLRASAQSKDGSAHEGEGSLGSGGLDPVQEERALRALPQPSKAALAWRKQRERSRSPSPDERPSTSNSRARPRTGEPPPDQAPALSGDENGSKGPGENGSKAKEGAAGVGEGGVDAAGVLSLKNVEVDALPPMGLPGQKPERRSILNFLRGKNTPEQGQEETKDWVADGLPESKDPLDPNAGARRDSVLRDSVGGKEKKAGSKDATPVQGVKVKDKGGVGKNVTSVGKDSAGKDAGRKATPTDVKGAAGKPQTPSEAGKSNQGDARSHSGSAAGEEQQEEEARSAGGSDDEEDHALREVQALAGSHARRKVVHDSEPRSFERWRGTGLVMKDAEIKEVSMLRGSQKPATGKGRETKQKTVLDKVGDAHVQVLEVKGLPKATDDQDGINTFVAVRMFASAATSKPDFEARSASVRGDGVLAATIRVKYGEDFQVPARRDEAILELEVFLDEISGDPRSIGRIRLPIDKMTRDAPTPAWLMLSRADGTATSAALHCGTQYIPHVRDPKALREMRRQDAAEQTMADSAGQDIPDWISCWDVREVKQYEKDRVTAKTLIERALDQDSIRVLEEAAKLIRDKFYHADPNAPEVIRRLGELKAEREVQNKVKKKLRILIDAPRSSYFWLLQSLRTALKDGNAAGLTMECTEIRDAIELIGVAEQELANAPEDPGAG